jgi:uncharacterized membrane protein YeaQ/YmgE (transglycosylase-associated protein family)
MGIITWLILGLIAGFIASKIVHHQGQGAVRDVLIGIGGALLGGFIFRLIGGRGVTGLNVWSMLVAVGGAVVLLLAWNAIERHRHPTATPTA